MITFNKQAIEDASKQFRVNLVNSITGPKPGNLIGSIDRQGILNVAVFSSVVHLGSHPPLIGFVLRPSFENKRDTYNNIIETGVYTINAIPLTLIENAHQTSTKFPAEVSEFETCSIQPTFRPETQAPFVKDSPIQLSMKFIESKLIEHNQTALMIGEVDAIHLDPEVVNEEGDIDLEKASIAAISGLKTYYTMQKIKSFEYQ